MSKLAEEIKDALTEAEGRRVVARFKIGIQPDDKYRTAAKEADLALIDEKLSGVRDIIKSMADTELEYQEQILSGNISKSLLASITEYPAIKLYESLKVD